ncbi:hypothetical protein BC830DRAFT_806376 [Chytriomyces sp. MP71]|nr:hypothetical protein BC830DRAFT_806376 [Chytriomyces sp. MP71]
METAIIMPLTMKARKVAIQTLIFWSSDKTLEMYRRPLLASKRSSGNSGGGRGEDCQSQLVGQGLALLCKPAAVYPKELANTQNISGCTANTHDKKASKLIRIAEKNAVCAVVGVKQLSGETEVSQLHTSGSASSSDNENERHDECNFSNTHGEAAEDIHQEAEEGKCCLSIASEPAPASLSSLLSMQKSTAKSGSMSGTRKQVVVDLTNKSRANSCTACKCKDTPQWRRGPQNYELLCNSCSLRWKRGNLELGVPHPYASSSKPSSVSNAKLPSPKRALSSKTRRAEPDKTRPRLPCDISDIKSKAKTANSKTSASSRKSSVTAGWRLTRQDSSLPTSTHFGTSRRASTSASLSKTTSRGRERKSATSATTHPPRAFDSVNSATTGRRASRARSVIPLANVPKQAPNNSKEGMRASTRFRPASGPPEIKGSSFNIADDEGEQNTASASVDISTVNVMAIEEDMLVDIEALDENDILDEEAINEQDALDGCIKETILGSETQTASAKAAKKKKKRVIPFSAKDVKKSCRGGT